MEKFSVLEFQPGYEGDDTIKILTINSIQYSVYELDQKYKHIKLKVRVLLIVVKVSTLN